MIQKMQPNVLDFFENGALTLAANKVALIDGSVEYKFSEVAFHAKNCAALIVSCTDSFNAPIAVFLPKSAGTIFADLGILYSGNCYANLDIKSPPERLKAILDNLGSDLIITSSQYVPALLDVGVLEQRLLLIETVLSDTTNWNESELQARRDRIIDTDPLCIIHTSGSTGIPKGVVLNHRSTLDFMNWAFARLELDGDEVIGSLSPFYFDIFTMELYFCLAKAATLVIIPEYLAAFPSRLLVFLSDKLVSFIFWVPTVMVNIANLNMLAQIPLPKMRKVLFAGEVFPTKHLNYWRRHLPKAMFVNLYGPIEITVDCTYFIVEREMGDEDKLPIGFPCRNSDILILNEENCLVDVNEHGELCVRGTSLALGYWNNPELTAKSFVQNPLQLHYPELIYRTGDTVYRNAQGEIMFVGRKDFQIKHLGYRIELGEIEHAALQIDGIKQSCIVYDAEAKEICLYFESEFDLSASEIRRELAARLPKYMLPTICQRVTQMPKNPNGKIDRLLLSRRHRVDL